MVKRKKEGLPASVIGQVRERRAAVLVGAVLFAVTLLVYLQVWRFELINLDDPTYVEQNPQVQAGITRDGVAWAFEGFHDGNWIPLTWLSLMLDTDVYGGRAGGYHFTNALLHAANAVLLFASAARRIGRLGDGA
jgi:protein O-mannosyl-transferase